MTYHLEIRVPQDAIEIPKVILSEDIQTFIKNKLIEYNQTTDGKVYIKQGICYVFIYVPVGIKGIQYMYNRVDIPR